MTLQEALQRAIAHHQRSELAPAEQIYRLILAHAPHHPDALHLLGMIAFQVGRLDDALELMGRAIDADPKVAEYQVSAGVVLDALGRTRESVAAFEKAVALQPTHAKALAYLGATLQNLALLDQSIHFTQKALAIAPEDAASWNTLGNALIRQGRVDQAIDAYRQAIARQNTFSQAWSNLLLCLHYRQTLTPQQIYQEHLRWARDCIGDVPECRGFANDRSPEHRLRIGYLSPDFCGHSVSYFIEPLLERHDRKRFEVFCYSDTRRTDATTERLRSYPLQWRESTRWNDQQLLDAIAHDQIDVLVDLAGHAGPNRLPMLARRAAPVQVSFLGYPNTTGLKAIDYRFTDALVDSPGVADARHTEQLIRIDPCAWCYRPPAHAPPVNSLPLDQAGFITFGCFNALAKVTPEMLATWSDILAQVPGSRLVLKALALNEAPTRQWIKQQFHGRLDLLPPNESLLDHLATYHQIDIALDTFPYHGTATTCEALWMGVPVVIRAADAHVSRVGASLLHAIGLDDLVASSQGQYVATVVELARNVSRLREMRSTLRDRMLRSPLLNEPAYVRKIEHVFVECVRG